MTVAHASADHRATTGELSPSFCLKLGARMRGYDQGWNEDRDS